MKLRIRIDAGDLVTNETLTEWVSSNSEDYCVVHHLVNENSHFHLYMDSPMVMSPQSMRYKLKTKFKLDKVEYCVGDCDPARVSEYLSYLFNTKHGNVANLISTSLDKDVIAQAMADADKISDAYNRTKVKRPTKSLYDMALEVRQTVKDERDKLEIIQMTVRLMHKYCKCHDGYLIRKVVDTVRSLVDPEEYAKNILAFYT